MRSQFDTKNTFSQLLQLLLILDFLGIISVLIFPGLGYMKNLLIYCYFIELYIELYTM